MRFSSGSLETIAMEIKLVVAILRLTVNADQYFDNFREIKFPLTFLFFWPNHEIYVPRNMPVPFSREIKFRLRENK